MRILYLLRHAHAASRNIGIADFDRPLDERGQEEAQVVASYLETKKINFDRVMCSASLRGQETLEPLRPVVQIKELDVSEKFYNISEDQILRYVQQLPDEVGNILYIGHNPGIAFAILRFARSFPSFLKEGVDPSTLIGFQFPIDKWEDVTWGMGEIIDMFQPKLAPAESLVQTES